MGDKIKYITFGVVIAVSLSLFLFASALNITEVKFDSIDENDGVSVITCVYNGDDAAYADDAVFVVTVKQKDLELAEGDTMAVYHFGDPKEDGGVFRIKAIHVTKHIKKD